MSMETSKNVQGRIWGLGPYEQLTQHFAPLHDHLVRVINPQPGEHILDVATGTGAVALRLAGAGATVTGLDLSPTMIETARRLAGEAGLKISYEVGDAEDLPYPDASFGVVVSSIGSMFAPDHRAVAAQFVRVCRPGGRLVLAHWSAEGGMADMFTVMAPFMPPPPPHAGSTFQWGRCEYIEELLGEAFTFVFEEGNAPQRGESGEEVWQLFSTVYGPTRNLVESLEPDRVEQLHTAFVDYYDGHRTGRGVVQPRRYVIARGSRR